MAMTDGVPRAESLFEAAMELERERRAAFLDSACGHDPELRGEVEALLAFADQARTADLFPHLFDEAPGSALIGEHIGPYTILREIGEGGMGAVFLAERADVGKRAAVKVIRDGRFASAEHVRRFLVERRALARLEHANIARLLDAGLTQQQLPYLIMEYVDGAPIDRYCDEHRLTIAERLRLFQNVCQAVHHAHQSLVVHRDLKPSNILVTAEGQVKLLDFGIAKLLEQGTAPDPTTRTGLVALTPEYASPEQARSEPITTASDVYSLGVVLYELLTGRRPYRLTSRTPAEVERVICNTIPERPSSAVMRLAPDVGADETMHAATPEEVSRCRGTEPQRLRRRLAGDLDTIVLKALAKEPGRRYPSAEGLRQDIELYLRELPVRAQPDTLGYRARKFVRRHRAVLGAATAVLAALVAALIVALWQNQQARRQRDLSVRAAHTMIFELADGLSRMSGPTEARLGLLAKAAAVFEEVEGAGLGTQEDGRQRADANRMLANAYSALGDAATALRHSARSEAGARLLVSAREATYRDSTLLAAALVEVGDAEAASKHADHSLRAYGEVVALGEGLIRNPHALPGGYRLLYLGLSRKADRLRNTGKLDSAAPLYQRAFGAADSLLRHDRENAQYQSLYATGIERLADVLYYSGHEDQSCLRYREALAVRRRAAALAPNDPVILRTLSNSTANVAWCDDRAGDTPAAVTLFREATDLQRRLLGNDPSNTLLATNLMGGLGEWAGLLRREGDLPGAIRQFRQALAVAEPFHARGSAVPTVTVKTAAIAQLLVDALVAGGEDAQARLTLARAETLLRPLADAQPDNAEYLGQLADFLTSAGALERRAGRLDAAQDRYDRALVLYQSAAHITGTSQNLQLVASAEYNRAMTLLRRSQPAPARQALRTARKTLLDLRAAGQLDETSDGYRQYLPSIEKALRDVGR